MRTSPLALNATWLADSTAPAFPAAWESSAPGSCRRATCAFLQHKAGPPQVASQPNVAGQSKAGDCGMLVLPDRVEELEGPFASKGKH